MSNIDSTYFENDREIDFEESVNHPTEFLYQIIWDGSIVKAKEQPNNYDKVSLKFRIPDTNRGIFTAKRYVADIDITYIGIIGDEFK